MTQRSKELEALCLQLLSINDQQKDAEQKYNNWITQSPETFLSSSRQILRTSTNNEVKAAVLVLLRLTLHHNYNNIINNSAANQYLLIVCSELIVTLSNETNELVRHQLNATVVDVASGMLKDGILFYFYCLFFQFIFSNSILIHLLNY